MRWVLWIMLAVTTAVFADPGSLTQTFSTKDYGYTIQYPAGWHYIDRGKGVVVFKGNEAYPLSVNIQTIYTKQGGGEYKSVKDLMNDFYTQVPMHTNDSKFYERKPIVLSEPDGTKLYGEQTTLSFREDGTTFKQWQVMLVNKDGNIFQAWAYRAPVEYFDSQYAAAAAMLNSWIIK